MSTVKEHIQQSLDEAWFLFGKVKPGSKHSDELLAIIADASLMLGDPGEAFPAAARDFGTKPPKEQA